MKGTGGFLSIVSAMVIAAAMSMTGSNEAKAFCAISAETPPGANCLGNGGPIPSFLNLEIGFLNDSGNANVVFGSGDEFHLSFFNAHIGLLNGSGNGNVI